ncbi:hypothetical protein BKA63DRAFT_497684 [Paraphoma chrysanthemicola]|nr:hypothetical protein BKA63DRAFT_573489 [Paraphoma chrysanthemicola]KAH7061836.1 hypothetical protein BKA63DRAFT_497684 [Paraphoma chrysanthemicola]
MTTPALVSEDGERKLYEQDTTPPDECATTVVLPPSVFRLGRLPGQYVLLLVPTANREEQLWLQSLLQDHVGEYTLVTYAYEVDTEIEQLYHDTVTEGLTNRLMAMIVVTESSVQILEELGIGTVIIGVVENYIRTSKHNDAAVDFGVAVFYDVGTGELVQTTTQGVPVQPSFLCEAQEQGLSSVRRRADSVTYGDIVQKYFGGPARQRYGSDFDIGKDWHRVVCGSSRYDLLRDACRVTLNNWSTLK